jgi:arylsulfatase A
MMRKLTTSYSVLGVALLQCFSAAAQVQKPIKKQQKPNVVFFLIDDLGYSDLGCYGSKYYETPTIDELACKGIRFTQNYAACTVCSPTRASILTGKYPGRLHITGPIPIKGAERRENPKMLDADYEMNMPLSEFTIGEAFKATGYTTAAIGKWHVCNDSAYFPHFQGFDYNIGGNMHGGPGNYFFPYEGKWRMTEKFPWIYWNTFPDGNPGEYLTDRLTDEAIKIIDRHKDEPFFIYLSHYAVHAPLQAKKEYIEKYKNKPVDEARGHTNPVYAAMIQSVDESVKKVLDKIDELGLAENTIVVLASDNGGADFATSNWPWHGNKGNYYEGGIRVPLIVKWPGKIKNHQTTDLKVISTDYYPTLLELCGLQARPEQCLDGLSLAQFLLNEKDSEKERIEKRDLFWHFPHYIEESKKEAAEPCSVIRSGDWKMIQWLEDWSVELYNLKDDPQEKTNVCGKYPELVKELEQKLATHRVATKVQMPSVNPNYRPMEK